MKVKYAELKILDNYAIKRVNYQMAAIFQILGT